MGKAIIQNFGSSNKSVRRFYQEAYHDLREFYAECRTGEHDDAALMQMKYDLWRKNGKYLDIAWQHHFALQVSQKTGKGDWHGWHTPIRFLKFTDGRWNDWHNTVYPIPF